jgi:hypothetical protein
VHYLGWGHKGALKKRWIIEIGVESALPEELRAQRHSQEKNIGLESALSKRWMLECAPSKRLGL